ncbi:hypothetical protein ACRE_030450 [Hapsidospora chrysogenum ATCC 11550]|uniref:Uncharacterized protein n=1 Tax=Hapsidospora chrysogenum (strain ATCC 11550 / CBS 779.69 / DSM 880 / IAM 14645 / JCM 23072 / IMI 49137) TaxID=857340 RepID=A0A086T9N5_HAPC1|nr:hypothetical protein ACRE_030450 [Hapsidospora chrysogenum ATCC 11550]
MNQQLVSQSQRPSAPETQRHTEEKKRLLDRLRRDKGNWNTNHPRHRLLDALHGYSRYHQRQTEELQRLRDLYTKAKKSQRKLLEKHIHYSEKFTHIERLIRRNQDLCDRIVANALQFYEIGQSELDAHIRELEANGRKADKVAVSQTLKHIVRDWTESGGAYERDACFSCLLKTLDTLFPDADDDASQVKVLLPGSGLGRLGRDMAQKRGYQVTLNEWSMYMNILYRYLETHAHSPNTQSLHPFIDTWSHHATTADMQRPLTFPDAPLNASELLLTEGDFTTVFNVEPRPQYDVIVTYFFIDTARNLASYLDTIKMALRPGGYWVNLGPLLYGSAPFVQLTLEDIVTVVEQGLGFTFLDVAGPECGEITLPGKLVRGMEAAYGFDDRALTRNAYNAQFWVARRSLQ